MNSTSVLENLGCQWTPLPLHVAYSPNYVAPARISSMAKLGWVASHLLDRSDVLIVKPEMVSVGSIRGLHDPKYVDAFLEGSLPLANSQNLAWSPELREAVLAALGGQLLAAREAMDKGIAANLAHGFHHARFHRGGGFCTFNGLALVAATYPHLKIAVLDCDEHAGDGTAEFCLRLPNLYNVTIHGKHSRFLCKESSRTLSIPLDPVTGNYGEYQRALNRAFEFLELTDPDLIIYQAGVDCHVNDPLGTLGLSESDLIQRDSEVFSWARRRSTPLFFVLAGGYSTQEEVSRLHLNTFEACLQEYGAEY